MNRAPPDNGSDNWADGLNWTPAEIQNPKLSDLNPEMSEMTSSIDVNKNNFTPEAILGASVSS